MEQCPVSTYGVFATQNFPTHFSATYVELSNQHCLEISFLYQQSQWRRGHCSCVSGRGEFSKLHRGVISLIVHKLWSQFCFKALSFSGCLLSCRGAVTDIMVPEATNQHTHIWKHTQIDTKPYTMSGIYMQQGRLMHINGCRQKIQSKYSKYICSDMSAVCVPSLLPNSFW